MDSLPQWDALSEGARAQLLQGVTASLHGNLVPQSDVESWDEMRQAGIVQPTDYLTLTGPGRCLVLDVLQNQGTIEQLAA